MPLNEHGQPVGPPVSGWTPRPAPTPVTLTGRTVTLQPLGTEHAADLYRALVEESAPRLWTYLFSGPFADREAFDAYLASVVDSPAMVGLAVIVDGVALGHECLMRVDQQHGSVEVGNIALGERLQRTTAATEVLWLLARHVFDDLGYRRFECQRLIAWATR